MMSRVPPSVRFLLVLYYVVAPPVEAVMYLYYSSPGDSLGHFSGVWGGPIDVSRKGQADNLRQSGFHCAYMYDGGFYTGFIVKGMFLDPISKRVIVHLVESFENRVSLIEGPICTEEPECPSEMSGRVTVYMAHGENEDVIAAEPGPFAMWNSSVYFVVARWSADAHRRYRHRLELRHLTGCRDQYPFTIHRRADIDECSRLLATLRQEQTRDQQAVTFHAAFHLHVLQNDEGDLAFVTQIYNWTLDADGGQRQLTMTLLHASADGAVRELYATRVPDDYLHMRLHLVETGGIDWKDGTLCWTAVEEIHCAPWSGSGGLGQVRTVLGAGRAATVCYDSDIYLNTANVTTGVAIAETAEDGAVSLYFGCRSDKPVEGGAGYLHAAPGASQPFIEALADREDIIYAGSMFLTDLCDIRPISIDDSDRYNSNVDSNRTDDGSPSSGAGRGSRRGLWWMGVVWTCAACLLRAATATRHRL